RIAATNYCLETQKLIELGYELANHLLKHQPGPRRRSKQHLATSSPQKLGQSQILGKHRAPLFSLPPSEPQE
ncbi:hypothetical protein QIG52_27215, partial [Klebsiella pneumoniae]|nr:hypothetical protein [Klebsiella pneumoniae]